MNSRDITVAAIQTMLHWEGKAANLEHFGRLMEKLEEPVDLLVLPEMFTTGFSMNPAKLAEPMEGPTLDWMREKASWLNAVVTGSFIVAENGKFYNRLLWVRPDGSYDYYSKRHLFRMAGEDKFYDFGHAKIFPQLFGWKICPLICYDLRFPVWCRNQWKLTADTWTPDFDVQIFVANWPERRAHAWKTLLMARAIENLSYVVGLNRIGNDGNFIFHSGESAFIDFKGEVMKSAVFSTEEVITTRLSYQLLMEYRQSFPAGLDADSFYIAH